MRKHNTSINLHLATLSLEQSLLWLFIAKLAIFWCRAIGYAMAIWTILREISNLIYKKIRAAENTMNFFLLADLAMTGYIWHRWRLYDNFLSGSTEQISYSFLVSTSTHYAQHHVFFKFQSTHYYFLILYGFLRNKLRHRNRKKRWGDLSK